MMKKHCTDCVQLGRAWIRVFCLAVTALLTTGSAVFAQDSGALLQEVQALLRQPLPQPPDGATLAPEKTEAERAQQLREMLFDDAVAGQAAPAVTPKIAGTAQTPLSLPAGPTTMAGNPPDGQLRVELPPAPPEKYAPTAAPRHTGAIPNPATIPLPPHPPESQAPSGVPRPPVSLPLPTAPAEPPARLPDPTVIPLPPHPPEEQAPWRQGV